MDEAKSVAAWFDAVVAQSQDHSDGIQKAYFQLDKYDRLSKVTLHRYQCSRPKPCQIARVVKVGSTVLCAVRDYRYSPGMNEAESVPEARRKNTLNGDNHWPGHVYDVTQMSEWGDSAGLDMVCRHFRGTVLARDILATVADVEPGFPKKPTRLIFGIA